MSPHGRPISVGPARPKGRLKDELRALKSLAPYLWPRDSLELRARVVLALAFLLAGKLVNIYVLLLYKHAVDALSPSNAVFAKVGQRAVRRLALTAFRHVHALSLRYHLERRTGGLSRAIDQQPFPRARPVLGGVFLCRLRPQQSVVCGGAIGRRHSAARL